MSSRTDFTITAVTSCFAQLFVLPTEEFLILFYLRNLSTLYTQAFLYSLGGLLVPRQRSLAWRPLSSVILSLTTFRQWFLVWRPPSSVILGLTPSLGSTWAAFLLVLCARLRFSHVMRLLIVTVFLSEHPSLDVMNKTWKVGLICKAEGIKGNWPIRKQSRMPSW